MDIREATAADREAILALRRRCFGDVDPEKSDPRFWEWEFGDARCFVAEERGALVSHLALVRTPYAIGGRTVHGALAVDAMTAPEARGRGVFSRVVAEAARATRDELEVSTAYQIRSAVLGAMLRGGWSIARSVPVLVRPASLRAWVGGGARAHARNAREGVRELAREDVPLMAGIAAAFVGNGAQVARTAAWLSWRFFDNPHWRYRVTAAGEGAYLVTRRTTLKGYDTLAVVDLAFTDRGAARRLLRDAVAEAAGLGCKLVAALVSPSHPAFPLLLLRGFVPGPHRFRLLVHPQTAASWRVVWADTDHL